MAIQVFNRREIKYIVPDALYLQIKPVLENYMEVDAHSKNGDFYTICNVYYDTNNHDLIRKSLDKPVYKEKLRLRSYGVPGLKDKVYLEIKKKFMGKVNKRRVSMQLEEAYRYFETKEAPVPKSVLNSQVIHEIDYLLLRYSLQPMLYLSYDRNAYFGKEEPEFRITFDTNIRTRRSEVALEKGNFGNSLLSPDLWIMEAKAENAFPLWFARLLAEYKLFPISFSKYGTEYRKTILGKDKQINNSLKQYLKEEINNV